jgi:hypothetical protein
MDIPFVGPSYDLLTRPSGVQRTINLVPVAQEPGNERVAWVFEDAPGLEAWSTDPGVDPGEPDPFFEDVILLIQNGEIIDRSPYARSLANSGAAGSATAGAASDFPGDLAVSMQCAALATGGLVMGTGPELTMGENSWCMEAFVTPKSGSTGLAGSTQTLYTSSDDRSRLSWFLLFNTGRMFVRCNGFDIPAAVSVPVTAVGSSWYLAVQFYSGSVAPWMWVGEVGDANATGDVSLTNCPRPLLGPLSGPYIGYQPTDNFITSNFNVAMRITNAERYAPAATIPIPTALWPTF